MPIIDNLENIIDLKAVLTNYLEGFEGGMGILDREGYCLWVNRWQASLFNKTVKETIGRSIWEIALEWSGGEIYRAWQRVTKNERHETLEYFSHEKQKWIEVRFQPRDGTILVLSLDISDRKIAETRKTQKIEFLEQLVDFSPNLIYIYDNVEGRNIYIGQNSLELIGYRAETIIDMGAEFFERAIHPEDLPKIIDHQTILESSPDDTCLEVEYRMLRADGQWRWFNSRERIFSRNDKKEIETIIGSAKDITEQKLALIALQASETRLQLATRALQGIIYDWDVLTDEVYRSEGLKLVTGFSPDEIPPTRQWWIERIHREDLARFSELIFDRGQDYHESEYRVRHKDGHWVTVWERAYLIRDGAGKVTRIVGCTTDITDRKKTEREREKLLLQLQEANALLDAVFNNAPVGIGVWDENIRYLRLNEALAEINGIPVEEHLGKTVTELLPKVSPEVMDNFRRVLRTGQPILDLEASGETPAFPGVTRYWSVSYYPIELPSRGRCLGAICLETTENKRSQALVEARAEELKEINSILLKTTKEVEQRNIELEQFAYAISHDLKTPLRAIANLSQWIEDDLQGKLEGETAGYMYLLRGRVHRLENLINGLLKYSSAGNTVREYERVHVKKLVENIIIGLKVTPAFSIEYRGDWPVIYTSRLLLERVFVNLIDNAVRHHDRNAGTIILSIDEADRFYEFSVTDDGPGIAPEHHHKVFSLFQTLEPRDKTENTGVGLPIVKKIIEQLGGRITIDSNGTRGTSFIFTWPK